MCCNARKERIYIVPFGVRALSDVSVSPQTATATITTNAADDEARPMRLLGDIRSISTANPFHGDPFQVTGPLLMHCDQFPYL